MVLQPNASDLTVEVSVGVTSPLVHVRLYSPIQLGSPKQNPKAPAFTTRVV